MDQQPRSFDVAMTRGDLEEDLQRRLARSVESDEVREADGQQV